MRRPPGLTISWTNGSAPIRSFARPFAARPTADILRPGAGADDEDARGFSRRFAALFRESPPWRMRVEKEAMPPSPGVGAAYPVSSGSADTLARKRQAPEARGDFEEAAQEARQQVAMNVAQTQKARRDVQMLSKVGSYAPRAEAAKEKDEAAFQPNEAPRPDRRGWLSWTGDGRLHLLGWLQPGGEGDVRGVEMELTALVSRMGGTLPAAVAGGEGYVLLDDKGRALHQAGWLPRGARAAARVPLAAELLPGWEVAAFVEGATSSDRISVGGGLLLVGSLLVGIFIVASLAGGSLLLRQAQRSGEEARQKTSFVANVSHEFKTPLTTIRLYAELLEQGRVPGEERRGEYLRTIGRETQRLARLVNNALDFSRLEQGRRKFQREPLDLGPELTRLLDTQAAAVRRGRPGPAARTAGRAADRRRSTATRWSRSS